MLNVNELEKALEQELTTCLSLCVNKHTHRVDRILNNHWRKSEFKLKDDDMAMYERATDAVRHVMALCRSVQKIATTCLDGANLTRFLEALALGVARSVRRKIGTLTISKGGGGLKLMRDLNELKEFFQSWPSSILQREFELLRDIANLYIVDEAQWKVSVAQRRCVTQAHESHDAAVAGRSRWSKRARSCACRVASCSRLLRAAATLSITWQSATFIEIDQGLASASTSS